jgi:soluble lytic murein transglycosylase-like protein
MHQRAPRPEQETKALNEQRISRVPRSDMATRRQDDLPALLRSRWVQAVLGVTVVLTFVGRLGGGVEEGVPGAMVPAAFVASPIVVTENGAANGETVGEAWRRVAVERESQRLAAQYVQRGYPVSAQLARDIHDAAQRYDIDPEIAFGLVRAESSFRNSATSHVGATGLTQLMPRTATWIAPGTTRADLRDPKKNLDIGFRYLRYLLDKYDGDIRLALLAYNRGPGTVDRVLRRGGNPDNGYVEMVLGTRTGKRR